MRLTPPAFSFRPPYGKRHIMVFGGLATVASTVLLAVLTAAQWQASPWWQDTFNPPSTTVVSGDRLRTVEGADLTALQQGSFAEGLRRSTLLVFDIRPMAEYRVRHVRGAGQLSPAIAAEIEIDTTKTVALYGGSSGDRQRVAEQLRAKGVRTVYILDDDLDTLASRGYVMVDNEPGLGGS